MTEELFKPTSGRALRNRNTFIAKIDEDLTVRMRRLDMTGLILMGIVPLPMLKAAGNFEEMASQVTEKTTNEEMLKIISEGERAGFINFLKEFVCKVVVEPVIVPVDDGNEDHVPVDDLSVIQLLGIWNASPIQEEPIVTTATAEEFRRPESNAPALDAPVGENVRTEAELVVGVGRDFIHA